MFMIVDYYANSPTREIISSDFFHGGKQLPVRAMNIFLLVGQLVIYVEKFCQPKDINTQQY
jgi:hypothetical protein